MPYTLKICDALQTAHSEAGQLPLLHAVEKVGSHTKGFFNTG